MSGRLDAELGLDELFVIYHCKIFEGGSFGLALRSTERHFVDKIPRQYEEWVEDMLRVLNWQSSGEVVPRSIPLHKGYRLVAWNEELVKKVLD